MSSNIIGPSPKKKLEPSEKVEKVTKMLDDIKNPVGTIHKKGLDKFQGKSTISTCWFNPDYEWLK